MSDLSSFLADPYRDWPSRYPGRRAIGYLCTYVPEELIHAAGFVPIRIMPVQGAASHADSHLQTYSCSLARGCLERSFTGELDFLAGVAFGHTCDTMQCLADVWREAQGAQGKWVGWVVQPVTLTSPHAKAYLVAELRRFAAGLEEGFGIRISDEALRASIALYNRNRRLLAELVARRDGLSAVARWHAVNAAMLIPPEDVPQIISRPVSALQSPPSGRIPLVLSGATLDDPALLALIEELGGQVVGDDLCNGERYSDTLVPEVEDPGARAVDPHHDPDPDLDTAFPNPWGALAERYLRRPPCPCKHSGLDSRQKHLLGLATARGAKGVIFVLKKFCDPHAWDYPPLAAALRTAGIPHLLLETEATTPVGVLRTRIEAFLEMLE